MNTLYKKTIIFVVTILIVGNNAFLEAISKDKKNRYLENNLQTKAPRADAANTSDGAVVGTLLGCDLSPVISLLNRIERSCAVTCSGSCNAISITAPTTITAPGYYCLANDIVGGITITADNVTLDLNNHTITGLGAGNGITINAGNNRIVKNGRINNFSIGVFADANVVTTVENIVITDSAVEGVTVNAGTTVLLNSLKITGVGTIGIHFTGANDSCTVETIKITNAQQGIIFDNISNSFIHNCAVLDCSSNFIPALSLSGIAILGGANNHIEACSVKNFQALDFPAGFFFDSTSNVVITDCMAQNIVQAPAGGNSAVGFSCTPSVTNTMEFIRCSALGIFGGQFVAGFEIDGNDISIVECIAQECRASVLNPLQGVGFFASGVGDSFTMCKAYNCSHQGFATNGIVANVTYEYCESSYNDTGFLTTVASVLIGNCVAFQNTTNGFSINAVGSAIYNCFASQNGTNYTGAGAINTQNANTQVVPGNPLANGPFAGGNLFI